MKIKVTNLFNEILQSDPLQRETNKTDNKHASMAARKEYRHLYVIHKCKDSNYRDLEKQTQRQYMKYKGSDKNLDREKQVSPKTQKRKYIATTDSCP